MHRFDVIFASLLENRRYAGFAWRFPPFMLRVLRNLKFSPGKARPMK